MPQSCKPSNACATEIRRMVIAAAEAGDSDKYTGKRTTLRSRAGMLLEITSDTNNAKATFSATMRDVGDCGIGFLTKHDLPVGTTLWVREFTEHNDAPWLKAKVIHKVKSIANYSIGVKVC